MLTLRRAPGLPGWFVSAALATLLVLNVPGPARAAVSDPAAFRSRIETLFTVRVASRYFVYYSNLPRETVASYAAFSDLFVGEVDREFFKVDNRFPLIAIVLPDRESFHGFLKREAGVASPPNFGIWLSDFNSFVTYHGSGLGTFAHEIMHPLVEESLKGRPEWAVEGIPAFFEKFFAYTEPGKAKFLWGFQNPWRIQELEKRLVTLDLQKIVGQSQDTSEKRLVSMFLFEQGKWNEFLSLVKRGDRRGFTTFVEAAMGKPFREIQPAWRRYLGSIADRRESIYRIPGSAIFRTEREMREYMDRYGLQ